MKTPTSTEAADVFHEPRDKIDAIVCENYRIYAHRAKQHVGSEVVTVQHLGVIKYLADLHGIPLTLQLAYQAKGFVTDARLRQLGLLQDTKAEHLSIHTNDALRHGVYWLMFA